MAGSAGAQVTAVDGRDDAPMGVRLLLAVVACGSVIPLLAWVYDLGSFAGWGVVVALPMVLLLIAATWWLDRDGRWPGTRAAITAGALGGLVGTLGYDLFRVPFVMGLGLQLLAPIDSYGVLLLGADVSSGTTAFAGWSYHTLNGLGFGVAYAVVMRGRHWSWGIVWGLVLETAVIVSPFATDYGLRTDAGFNVLPIALAYLAHVPYGFAVGRAAQHAEQRQTFARSFTRRPVAASVVAVGVAFAVWLSPLLPDARADRGAAVADVPSAIVDERGDWQPSWLRIAPGGCAAVAIDPESELARVTVAMPGTAIADQRVLRAGEVLELCPERSGVSRWQVDQQRFSGGWIIVDDALEGSR